MVPIKKYTHLIFCCNIFPKKKTNSQRKKISLSRKKINLLKKKIRLSILSPHKNSKTSLWNLWIKNTLKIISQTFLSITLATLWESDPNSTRIINQFKFKIKIKMRLSTKKMTKLWWCCWRSPDKICAWISWKVIFKIIYRPQKYNKKFLIKIKIFSLPYRPDKSGLSPLKKTNNGNSPNSLSSLKWKRFFIIHT